jgi:oxaloacetate decarboxylase gamma subunit
MKMLEQSAILTVLGMAVVFIFLWIMIICMNLSGKAIHKFGLDKDVQPPASSPAAPAGTPPQVTAAISAAVNEYQNSKSEKKG